MAAFSALLLAAVTGCAHAGGWQVDHGSQQSQTGPQSFATVHAIEPSSTYNLVIECAPDGLQLSFGGRFSEAGATLQFDDAAPRRVPVLLSRRGVPVVDLRAPLDLTTVAQLLVASSRLAVHTDATAEAPAKVVAFDVTQADRAIRRLDCRPR